MASLRLPAILAILAAIAILLSCTTAEATSHIARHHSRPIHRHRASTGASSLCRCTEFPALCNAIVKPLQRRGAVTAASLTQASIHAAISKTVRARATINRIMSSPRTGKDVRENLGVCQTTYGDALSSFMTAIRSLRTRSHATAMINLSAAVTAYETCDEGFTELPGVVSPIAGINSNLQKLARNSLALAGSFK